MELKEFITNTLTQIAEGVQEAINIAATKVPAFKAGRALKDAVSE